MHAPVGHAIGLKSKGPSTGNASLAAETGARSSDGPVLQSLPARPRSAKRKGISASAIHGERPTPIHDIGHNSHGSQLERVCRKRHQADCHDLSNQTSTRKRRVQLHANCTGHKNNKRKADHDAQAIASIKRLRDGTLDKDLGLGRSIG